MESTDESSNLHSDIHEMRSRIWSAFENSLYPDDDNLIGSNGAANVMTNPDRIWSYNELRGKSWPELLTKMENEQGNDFNHNSYILFFMTPKAFAYYLPAFMIRTLVDEGDNVRNDLLFLLYSSEKDRRKTLEEIKRSLSCVQIESIRDYINFIYKIGEEDDEAYSELISTWQ